jgi:cytochrome c-type biogenesis protein CcmH
MSASPSKPLISRARVAMCAAFLAAVAALVAGLSYQSARAQNPTPSDDDVNRIAHQLYCPVCENTPLDVCPTEACRQWRDLIRQQLSQGWSEARIKQYFVDQYGARVLAEPPPAGLNWLVYVLPPVIIVAGAVLLLRALRAWTKPEGTPASKPGDGSESSKPDVHMDEYVARLEDELKKRN